MAHARCNNRKRILVAGSIAVMSLAWLGGCATNPTFAHRFDHCMQTWKAQERSPQMTVRPKGEQMVDYCVTWARAGMNQGPVIAHTHK